MHVIRELRVTQLCPGLGALFSGNYFGGDVRTRAEALASNVSWSAAIQGDLESGQER